MADRTSLNVPGMEDTAKQLSSAVNEFRGALEQLQASLDRDDGCWSEDKIGKGFEQNYKGNADGTVDSLKEYKDSLGSLADKTLPTIVSNLENVDVDYGKAVNAYADQLRESDKESQE